MKTTPAKTSPALLRVHGHHSLLVGVDGPRAIAERARALGYGAVALCDVDSVAGIVEWVRAGVGEVAARVSGALAGVVFDGTPDQEAGIVEAVREGAASLETPLKTIVGAELSDPCGRPGRVVALVESLAGWRNLCKLVSARQLGVDPGVAGAGDDAERDFNPRAFDLVQEVIAHQEGLVFLVDDARLVLELVGRVGRRQLWAALPLPPAGWDAALAQARRAVRECGDGGEGAGALLDQLEGEAWRLGDPVPVDAEEAELLANKKCASPARASVAGVAALVGAARANGVGLVAAPDVWYLDAARGRAVQRVRVAVRRNALVERVPEAWLAAEGAHLPAPEALAGAFAAYAPVLEGLAPADLVGSSARIAARLGFTPELDGVVFPDVDCGAAGSPYSELARLAFQGAAKRYQPITPAVVERLQTELAAIETLGFAAYFLLVHQIAGFAKASGIPCVGRGSAADSLVAYCLELTDADPLRYRLPFERFLNPTRKDRPDIDLDFCWRRRDEVLDAVYTTFGPERTAMISTLGCFGLRSAFREAALVVGLAPAEFERWSKRLPWGPPARESWQAPPPKLAQLATNPVAQAFLALPECRHFPFDDARFVRALEVAGDLLDVPRHMGLHPGGVVVAPGSITDFVACGQAAKGPVVTQFDKHGVEALGLVKMDLLGNRALTVLDDCLAILRAGGVEVDLAALPEDDAATAEVLRTGRTLGCFQIESPGMRHLLQQIEARTMDDVIQAVALIRPGPAGSGMKDAFIRRFRGLEPPTPPHPLLADVLAETHGVMLYQEDVMQVAVALAGMTLAEADRLRRALSKRRSRDLEELGARFRDGARARGVSGRDAAHVWELIANFAAFGFCKAHAVTYGRIAYRAAWLKTHYPGPFLAAFLASHTGYFAPRVYVEEARRLGARILGPDVNRSDADFRFEGGAGELGAIRTGLEQIKGLSETTVAALLAARAADGPFLSLPDLVERTPADRGELQALIRTGALDAFDRTRPELLWRLHLLSTPERRAPRDARLDLVELESLRSTPRSRALELASNTGWGGSGGRLPDFSGLVAEPSCPLPTAAEAKRGLPTLADAAHGEAAPPDARAGAVPNAQHPVAPPQAEAAPQPAFEASERAAVRAAAEAPNAPPSKPNQATLGFPLVELRPTALPALPQALPAEAAVSELELLGFTTRLHPVRLFAHLLPKATLTPCREVLARAGETLTVRGWLAASRRHRGTDGRWIRFLTLEDESGITEAAMFADTNDRYGPIVMGPGPYLVTGEARAQMGAVTLHVTKVIAPPR